MLGTLPAPILLDIAIVFTALSWGLGFFIADRKVYLFASLAIGCFVCLFGYSVASAGAPPWAVVAAPVPLDILLLWYVMRSGPPAPDLFFPVTPIAFTRAASICGARAPLDYFTYCEVVSGSAHCDAQAS
jgi:hypothetical protein